jgi:flagellar hook-associated protein 1 FlgK
MGEEKMSSISGIFNSTLSALNTYTSAIDVISTNIGNVETPGYSRQQAVIQSKMPINTANGVIGTGVGVTNIERIYNAFLVTQLRMANQDMGKWSAQQEGLNAIEQIFSNSSDSGLSSTMSAFWNNWQNLVNNPSGSTERSLLANSANNMVKAFHSMSSQLVDVQQGLDKGVVETVAMVNQLIQKIADLNQNIKQAQVAGQNTNSTKDELDLQVAKLAELININAYTNTNGQISIQLASGKPLVEGNSTWLLSTQTNDTTGLKDITWPDGSATPPVVNDDITGGKLGGYLAVRDTMIIDYQDQLDTLARSVIDEVNWLHTGGYDVSGDIGGLFFSSEPIPAVATSAVSPTINLDSGMATGGTFSATINAYDSNLNAIPLKITFTKTAANNWSWAASIPDTAGSTAATGTLVFAATGQLVAGGIDQTIALTLTNGATTPQTVTWDLYTAGVTNGDLTQFDAPSSTSVNAANIEVNADILDDPDLVAAAATAAGAPGNGSNAADIAELQNWLNPTLGAATFSNYFSALTSKVGSAVQTTGANYSYQSSAIQAWQNQRDSYSGVSVDEEQTKLILYQNAYTASAKLMTVLNEMMKTLLNM